MKKGKLVNLINENVDKEFLNNMNEDSYFDGHKFVEYGKNIPNINLIMPSTDEAEYEIDKDKLVIKWGVKFHFRNTGIEGFEANVLALDANVTANIEGEKQPMPINFAEYKIDVVYEKDVESKDLSLYVTSIEIDAERKVVTVVISI